jgi:uncharacterized protein (TIGR00725 family)
MTSVKGQGQRALSVVGVMGSGSFADVPRCEALGRWLANEHVHLLTGGGGGAMEAVSRGFFAVKQRKGLVLGILPARSANDPSPPEGYPNRWVELPVLTHLYKRGSEGADLESRNHVNVLSADVVIAVAGSSGTRSEVCLAVEYGRPVVAYVQDRSDIPELPETVRVVSDLAGLQRFVRRALGRAP